MTNLTIISKQPEQEKVQHKIGNWYQATDREDRSNEFYILSNVCGKVVLVSTMGAFWDTPRDTYSEQGITYPQIPESVFKQVCSGAGFKLVENITITEG